MFAICLNTLKETLRNTYFSLLFFFSLILLLSLIVLNTLSLSESEYIILDFGLSFIELSGFFMLLFLGNRLFAREFEEKTLYLMLSRPIQRSVILFGKFLGFSLVLLSVMLIESLLLCILMWFFHVSFSLLFFISLLGIFLKLLSLLALLLLFSIICSSALATFLTLACYIIGHGGYALLSAGLASGTPFFTILSQGILIFFPNLQTLNTKALLHIDIPIALGTLTIGYGLACLYILLVLILGAFLFQKRSFEHI